MTSTRAVSVSVEPGAPLGSRSSRPARRRSAHRRTKAADSTRTCSRRNSLAPGVRQITRYRRRSSVVTAPPVSRRWPDDGRRQLAPYRSSGRSASRSERARKVGKAQDVAGPEARTAHAVDAPPLGRVAQDQVENRVQIRLRPRQLDARACGLDRRLDERPPRQASRSGGARPRARRPRRERHTTPSRCGTSASTRR